MRRILRIDTIRTSTQDDPYSKRLHLSRNTFWLPSEVGDFLSAREHFSVDIDLA
jgi:hypothetical protein